MSIVQTKITVGNSRNLQPIPLSSTSVNETTQIISNQNINNNLNFGDFSHIKLYDICRGSFIKHRKKRKAITSIDTNSSNNVQSEIERDQRRRIDNTRQLRQEPPKPIAKSTGPRVEFIDGKMVIKESSLEIGQDVGEDNYIYEEIEEAGNQSSTTYASFKKRDKNTIWGLEETKLFYQAIRQCGLNFSLMQAFFPGRTRVSLKRKFYREDKQNPELVKLCLEKSAPLDLTVFSTHFNDDSLGNENLGEILTADNKEDNIDDS